MIVLLWAVFIVDMVQICWQVLHFLPWHDLDPFSVVWTISLLLVMRLVRFGGCLKARMDSSTANNPVEGGFAFLNATKLEDMIIQAHPLI